MIKRLDPASLPDWDLVDVYDKSGKLVVDKRNCDVKKYQEQRTGFWVISGKVETQVHGEFFDYDEVTLHFGNDEKLHVVIDMNGSFKASGRGYYTEE